MLTSKIIEGKLQADGLKFALVASRFNDFIVEHLIKGAIDYLIRHGSNQNNLTLVKVPGAFEIAQAAKQLAHSKKYDGIICLGAIIRGGTAHYELLANETIKCIAQINMESEIPVGYGLLTTDNLEQAIERAGTKVGNKGAEAAAATLEMIHVLKQI